MTNGEYIGAGSDTTKLLLHLNGNSTDSSGNGSNGTDTNITYVDGKFGKCASFNGSSSFINCGNINIVGNIGVGLWINMIAMPGVGGNPTIAAKQYTGTDTPWQLYLLNTAGVISLHFGNYYNTTGEHKTTWNITGWNINEWHHFFCQYNGTAYQIYFDGKLVSSTDSTSGIGSFSTDNVFGYNGSSGYTNMRLDEVIIENRAWSASEVKKYYTYAKGRFHL